MLDAPFCTCGRGCYCDSMNVADEFMNQGLYTVILPCQDEAGEPHVHVTSYAIPQDKLRFALNPSMATREAFAVGMALLSVRENA